VGMDDHLAKPVEMDDLRRVLDERRRTRLPTLDPPSPSGGRDASGSVGMESIARLRALEADGAPGHLASLAHDLDGSFRDGIAAMRVAVASRDAQALEVAQAEAYLGVTGKPVACPRS